jgi:tetratricopeptide (TPR) repeat protein
MTISSNDQQILDMIFSNDMAPLNDTAVNPPTIDPNELMKLKQMELEAVQVSEADPLQAIDILTKAIHINSQYGSLYNNRAQLYRIRGDLEHALKDLDMAVEYGDYAVLKQAFTQRALVKKQLGLPFEQDFEKGAQFGNDIAKEQVRNNPIAKLCNETLLHVLNLEKAKQ